MESIKVLERELDSDLKDGIAHGILVSRLARCLSKELNMPAAFCEQMAVAGLLHDIGKLKLTPYLYGRRDDTLHVEEIKYMRMHSTFSYEILKEFDYSDTILRAVYYHHENYDGSGYPKNLKGDDIPLGARILRPCDVSAALISDRPYRSSFDVKTAVELMVDEVKNFDMQIFLAFQRVIYYDKFDDLIHMDMFGDGDEILYEKLLS